MELLDVFSLSRIFFFFTLHPIGWHPWDYAALPVDGKLVRAPQELQVPPRSRPGDGGGAKGAFNRPHRPFTTNNLPCPLICGDPSRVSRPHRLFPPILPFLSISLPVLAPLSGLGPNTRRRSRRPSPPRARPRCSTPIRPSSTAPPPPGTPKSWPPS